MEENQKQQTEWRSHLAEWCMRMFCKKWKWDEKGRRDETWKKHTIISLFKLNNKQTHEIKKNDDSKQQQQQERNEKDNDDKILYVI